MEYKKPKATLMWSTPLEIAEIAGRICYNSFDNSEHSVIRNFPKTKQAVMPTKKIDSSDLLSKLFWVHFHESVGEHINLTYHVENVSREVVIELNRHRIGIATSQKSSRYTIEDLVNAWVDYNESRKPSKELNKYVKEDACYQNFAKIVYSNIIHDSDDLVSSTVDYLDNMLIHYNYEEPLIKGITGSKKKKQNDRVKRALPESWMLEGVWTFNLRALKHLFDLRDSGAAYYGIREFVQELKRVTPKKYLDLIVKDSSETSS